MRKTRVYTPQPLTPGQQVELEPGPAHHLANVLRMKPGRELVLFNGKGGEYQALILSIGKRRVLVEILLHSPREAESSLRIVLAQGLPRGERMDYVTQKAVELGVAELVPLITERSVARTDDARTRRRQAHLQSVAIAACEQCGRNQVPRVHYPLPLDTWLEDELPQIRLALDPDGDHTLTQLHEAPRDLALLAGPEGGLSAEEYRLAAARGFRGLRIGPRVLRTETAALVAVTAVQLRWGDLS